MVQTTGSKPAPSKATSNNFLSNGGEMAELIAGYNWEESSLGSITEWPASLKTTLGIILHSGFPQFFFWGKELICFYNDAFRPSLGVEGKHPAIGKKGKDVWPEIWDFIGPLIEKVMTTGAYVKFEDQLVPFYRNGKIEDIYWTFCYSPAYNDHGEINGVYVTCTETTQKVTNLKQLEESNDLLEFAIEATELGTWDYCPPTGKFIGNKRLKEWFGVDSQQPIELATAMEFIAEKDRARVDNAIQKALDKSSDGKYDLEYTILHPATQTERIVRSKGKAWFTEEGIAYRFNGTLQDITDQRQSEQAVNISETKLKETQERFKLALSAGALATFIWEIPNDRMFPDENMCKLFGQKYPMNDGMPLHIFVDAIHPEDIPRTMEKVQEAVETGCNYRTEYRVKGIDGIWRWVIASGKVEYKKDGRPNYFSGFLLDITDRKKIESALQVSTQKLQEINLELKNNNEQLTKANTDLDNFIYTASHDLKSPVANIEGLINTLSEMINRESPSKEELNSIVKMLEHSLNRFSKTVNDLTTITKIQKDYEDAPAENVDLVELIEEIKACNSDLILKSDAEILVDCNECLKLNFSRKNLHSILLNLITNAIKYRSPDRRPCVNVTTEKKEGFIVLKVSDNGLGLDEHKQKKLFSMFKRFHDHVEGTGIGLYLVKRIITNSGGRIEVESLPGVGSSFNVYFKV